MTPTDKLIKILDDLLMPKETITARDKIVNDLGADSLDCIEFLINVAKDFNICINATDCERLFNHDTTIHDVSEYLRLNHNII